MASIDKPRILAALAALLAEDLDALLQATSQARDEATSDESRPENKYDTRATEASYLAAGQGERLLALRRLAAWSTSPHAVGAPLYVLEGDHGASWYLLAPDGGGRRIHVDGKEIVVVTAASPVGAALVTSRPGDIVTLGPPLARRDHEVLLVV